MSNFCLVCLAELATDDRSRCCSEECEEQASREDEFGHSFDGPEPYDTD